MVWKIIIWKLLTCRSHQITEWWQIQQKWNNQRIFRIRHQFHNTAVNFRLMCCPQMIQNSNHRTDFRTFILGFKTNRQNSGNTRYVLFHLQNTYPKRSWHYGFQSCNEFKSMQNSKLYYLVCPQKKAHLILLHLFVLFATYRHAEWL